MIVRLVELSDRAWRVCLCAIYINLRPMIQDYIAAHVAHIKFLVAFVPKRLGPGNLSNKNVLIV